MAVGLVAHIQAEILHAGHMEIPFVQRLFVHCADVGKTFFLEVQRKIAADEAARTSNDDQIVLFRGRAFFYESFGVFHKNNIGSAWRQRIAVLMFVENFSLSFAFGNVHFWPMHIYY